MVWQSEQAMKCPNCGTWDWQWEEDENFWHADLWTCWGCKHRAEVEREVQNSPHENHDGKQIRWFSEPREE